jgi:hypothetical protein
MPGSIQAGPNPSPTFNVLSGVSCTSATACTTVGTTLSDGGFILATFAEGWDATAWSIQSAPSTESNFPATGRIFLYDAAKESNLPSGGLPRPAGFEDRRGGPERPRGYWAYHLGGTAKGTVLSLSTINRDG